MVCPSLSTFVFNPHPIELAAPFAPPVFRPPSSSLFPFPFRSLCFLLVVSCRYPPAKSSEKRGTRAIFGEGRAGRVDGGAKNDAARDYGNLAGRCTCSSELFAGSSAPFRSRSPVPIITIPFRNGDETGETLQSSMISIPLTMDHDELRAHSVCIFSHIPGYEKDFSVSVLERLNSSTSSLQELLRFLHRLLVLGISSTNP